MFNFFNKPKAPVSLPFTTDIHCHVLPGVDDGSPDIETSITLVKRLDEMGITRIFASPHVTKGTFENTPGRLDAALADLKQALDNEGVTIAIDRHAEYRLDDYSLSFFESGDIKPLPGDYVMIENPFVAEAWFIDRVIFDLQVKGFTPILAHPERYTYYFKNRGRYRQLHDAGAKFQINLLSLAEGYGKEQREIAEKLIEEGMVDFVGTDLHNVRHADILDEYLTSKRAARHFAALTDKLQNDRL